MRTIWMMLAVLMSQACVHENRHVISAISEGSITIDGARHEAAWANVHPIDAFVNPWNKAVSPETALFLLKDSTSLYFFFDVVDHDILAVQPLAHERDIEKGDRVELFFSKDSGMQAYYCFEIDPNGATLAYAAKNYRQLDFDWDVPSGFHAAGQRHASGYTVEGAIPLSFIDTLRSGTTLYVGAYRAEFSRQDDGTVVENWLTWIDPETPDPDFHVPSSLGRMTLSGAINH